MEDTDGLRYRRVLVGVLAVVAAGAITDVVLDAPERWLSFHVVLELGVAAVSLGMIAHLAWRWGRAERSLSRTRRRLEERRIERDEWKRKAEGALAGLAVAIDRQLLEWQLTPAERAVAFGLLKGRSHKRIATLTGRSERTVRQHAIAVYQKAGVAGRAELAAFFLDDLLPGGGGEGLTPYHGTDAIVEGATPKEVER